MKSSRYKKYKRTYEKYRKVKGRIITQKYWNKINFGGMRDYVLERDNWTCQDCGMTQEQHILIFGKNITIHHIDQKGSTSEIKNNNLNNLITLCLRCHGKRDNKARRTFGNQYVRGVRIK